MKPQESKILTPEWIIQCVELLIQYHDNLVYGVGTIKSQGRAEVVDIHLYTAYT